MGRPREFLPKFMLQKISKILEEKKSTLPGQEKKHFFNKPFPKGILINGFAKIPNSIIQDPALTSQEYRVLSGLALHSMNKNTCNPSDKTLAKEISLSEATIKRSRIKLRKLHYIYWRRTRTSNIYLMLYKIQDYREEIKIFEATPLNQLLFRLKSLKRKVI